MSRLISHTILKSGHSAKYRSISIQGEACRAAAAAGDRDLRVPRMWPLFPLVVEGLLLPALAVAAALGLAAAQGFAPPWAPLVAVLAFSLKTRVTGMARASQSAGTVEREDHVGRVAVVKDTARKPGPMRMYKATASNTFRVGQIKSRESKQARLDLSSFCHVIEVNTEEGWCDLEGSTTFETFVAETAKHGWMPLVIPELKTITVGGSIVGIGIESSSFKHGFVHEGLLQADILVASGEVLTVSADSEHADLFSAIPNSLGAFGYLLRLRMRIQRTKPFVKITKTWFDSPANFIDALAAECSQDKGHDFVDGARAASTRCPHYYYRHPVAAGLAAAPTGLCTSQQ